MYKPERPATERPPLPGSGQAEDFSLAFFVSAGVVSFIALFVVWATAGLPFALALAYLVDRFVIGR